MNKLNHVAIIMDGNGRWGKNKGKSRNFGHINGIKVIEKLVKISIKNPYFDFLTFFHQKIGKDQKVRFHFF